MPCDRERAGRRPAGVGRYREALSLDKVTHTQGWDKFGRVVSEARSALSTWQYSYRLRATFAMRWSLTSRCTCPPREQLGEPNPAR